MMDDERLKNPDNIFGKDYFDEQLAVVRDIGSSDIRFYQKIMDIYSSCRPEYIKDSNFTKRFLQCFKISCTAQQPEKCN